MSKRVYKYKLGAVGITALVMPYGTQVLSVHSQDNEVMLWALLDDAGFAPEKRCFYAATTGQEMPDDGRKFIGTVLLEGGAFVTHIFEVAP